MVQLSAHHLAKMKLGNSCPWLQKTAGLAAQNRKMNHSIHKMSISRLLDTAWRTRKFCDASKWPQIYAKFEFVQISFYRTPVAYVRLTLS